MSTERCNLRLPYSTELCERPKGHAGSHFAIEVTDDEMKVLRRIAELARTVIDPPEELRRALDKLAEVSRSKPF